MPLVEVPKVCHSYLRTQSVGELKSRDSRRLRFLEDSTKDKRRFYVFLKICEPYVSRYILPCTIRD